VTPLSFAENQDDFHRRVCRMVWCTVASVDTKGRPRSRILHPIWDGATGWIATGRHSHKAKHLAANPYVSLSYWDPQQEQVYVDAKTEWADGIEDKKRLWNLLADTPPPAGYDPGLFWKDVNDPGFGALKLTPWRIELWSLGEMAGGKPPVVWRAGG